MTAVPTLPTDAAPLQFLVVCPRGEHLDTLRGLTRYWACATHIHWTADPDDALRHAQEEPLVLAILDARIDRASGCTLSRALAGSRVNLDVLSFDEPGAAAATCQPSTWHWAELPRAVSWWVQRHLQPPLPVRYQ